MSEHREIRPESSTHIDTTATAAVNANGTPNTPMKMEATALTAYDNNGGCGVPSVCSPSSVSSPVAKTHGDGLHGDLFDGSHRRSSTSSSDTAENGAPVMPISHHPDINTSDSSSQSPSVSDAKMQTQSPPPPQIPRLDFEKLKKESSSASSTSDTHSHQMALPLPLSPALSSTSPSSAVYNTFSFEEVMSPRHQNGKRYLGGYLQHRVSMAGGFLKSWKRKYFRLRDHGIVCYKNREDSSPLFEILFKAHSMVLLGKLNSEGGSSSSTTNSKTVDRHDPGANEGSGGSTSSSSKGKVTGSLVFILKHVEIVSHQTPAGKVEVPLYLKAESGNDYTNWIECLRLKIDARKRAVAHSTVQAVVSGSSNSRTDSYSEQRSTAVGSERGGAGTGLTTDAESESAVARKKSGADEAQSPTKGKPVRAADSQQQQQKDNTKNALYDPSTSTDPPEFAQFQSKYLLMKEIGEGSFSIVHKAVNRLTGRLCAVKCCKYSTALEEEVSIMRKLSHPNIVGVEGVYHQDNMYFVVMDLMENGDLCDRLIQRQKLPECEVQVIISQVLQGLEYLHRHNILHRDIKPENILLHGDAVKIADFGLAKQLPNAASMLKRSCGTLEYAAPELLVGQPYGLKSDIFSLGVVLYVLLFGAFPFSIESAAALQCMERFPEGIDVRDMSCLSRENIQWRSVSQQAQDVILKMLAPKEKDRVSAKDLLVHPWFDPERTSSTASLGAVLPNLHRDSNTWKVLEMNAAGQECVRLADCEVKGFKELLGRGLEMTKYGNKGSTAPHATTLSIDFPQQVLSWTARPGPLAMGSVRKATVDGSPGKRADSRSIRLCDIQEVRLGHATDAFKHAVAKGKDPPPPELCISIVCSWRTLDLVVKAPSQREFLSKGLLRLINGGSRKV